MKITLLGTGTSQGIPVIGCECPTCLSSNPKDKRLRVSCLVEVGDKRIVIDTGPDFRQQMLQAGGKEIHAILITHEHNDHIIGLDDVRPFNFKYEKDIPVYAMPRVAEDIRIKFPYIFNSSPYPGAPRIALHAIEENDKILDIEGISVIPMNVMHGQLAILGFRIRNFAYLTDVKTIPVPEFKKLRNLDVLVLNALREGEHHSHLTIAEAKELAQKINAKRTYFTHFSHLAGLHDKLKKEMPENIYLGYDGLEIETE